MNYTFLLILPNWIDYNPIFPNPKLFFWKRRTQFCQPWRDFAAQILGIHCSSFKKIIKLFKKKDQPKHSVHSWNEFLTYLRRSFGSKMFSLKSQGFENLQVPPKGRFFAENSSRHGEGSFYNHERCFPFRDLSLVPVRKFLIVLFARES